MLAQSPTDILAAIDAMKRQRPVVLGAALAPSNAVEEILVQIWAEVLRLDRVGVTDNFFYLGGDSIQLTQVSARVRDRFGLEIDFAYFFEEPTVAGIARIVRQEAGEVIAERVTPLRATLNSICLDTSDWKINSRAVEDIRCLVIPTSDRPDTLQRCVQSATANLLRNNRECRLVIVDDSRSPECAQKNLAIVEELARSCDLIVQYFGKEEYTTYITELTNGGIVPHVAEFALRGWSQHGSLAGAGAPRNFLLLIAAGEAFASIDDDTESLYARHSNYSPHVKEQNNSVDPSTLTPWPDLDTTLTALPPFDIDFLAVHEQLLGHEFTKLDGRVLTTMFGVAGDCGWGSPSRFFQYQEQIARSGIDWNTAIACRDMLRAPTSYVVSSGAEMLMTTAFAATGKVLLPPFMPVGRGSDLIFGRLMKIIYPSALFGHLPFGVLHTPAAVRKFWLGEQFRSAGTSDISTMCLALLKNCPHASEPVEAFHRVGEYLQDIAQSPLADFEEMLREQTRVFIEEQLSAIEQQADAVRSMCSMVAEDAVQYCDKARGQLNGPNAGLPVELLSNDDSSHALADARKLMGQFGELLFAWPTILAIGRDMKLL